MNARPYPPLLSRPEEWKAIDRINEAIKTVRIGPVNNRWIEGLETLRTAIEDYDVLKKIVAGREVES